MLFAFVLVAQIGSLGYEILGKITRNLAVAQIGVDVFVDFKWRIDIFEKTDERFH